jgi:hypothetical protein
MSTTITEMPHSQPKREAERAAALYLSVITTEGRFIEAGQAFLEGVEGLDRAAVVRSAAECLARTLLPHATLAEVEQAVWRDMRRLFGWQDLTGLEPGGHA